MGKPSESTKATRSIVVLGGGTAGWLVALMLQRFAQMNALNLKISVVESSSIPTVGVGEGTTAIFRHILRRLGLDEGEFIRSTGATLKLGIRHQGWANKAKSYNAPIDDPRHLPEIPVGQSAVLAVGLHAQAIASSRPLEEVHLFGHLMQHNQVPWRIDDHDTLQPVSPFDYAFHFDQARAGQWLRQKASDIADVDARMVGAERDPFSGDIKALLLEGDERIEADFFIDCSGFHRALVRGSLQGEWMSYAGDLPANRALTFWLEHDQTRDIAPYTLAAAQSAGWMWVIPTQDRLGCGYVYSEAFLDQESAQREIERTLRRPIEPRNNLRFEPGRMKDAWIKNCLAVGLSSSFLEPLEATSIHGTIVQMMYFTEACLHSLWIPTAAETARRGYNSFVARQVDDFRDFINLHYVSRRTEPFWQEVQRSFIIEVNRRRISSWRRRMPGPEDFDRLPGNLPHVQEQLYIPVLAGLGLVRKPSARSFLKGLPGIGSATIDMGPKLRQRHLETSAHCLSHRGFLQSIEGETIAADLT